MKVKIGDKAIVISGCSKGNGRCRNCPDDGTPLIVYEILPGDGVRLRNEKTGAYCAFIFRNIKLLPNKIINWRERIK